MNRTIVAGAIALALITAISAVSQQSKSGGSSSIAKSPAVIAHGKYLVENVGTCGDCHSPHDQTGQEVKGQHLHGAPVMFKPTVPVPDWKIVAPPIAGLKQYSDQEGVVFFTTGKRPDGSYAGPPMPPFRFNKADAAAVVAYLKTLK